MPYIGNIPTTAFTSLAKQDITGNGGTIYTLDHEVSSPNDIAVFLNNVRQEPTEAYSASGTTLTMTGAIQSSDNFYVIFIGKAIQTTTPPDGSVSTSKIANDAVTTSKILDSSITHAKTNFISTSSAPGLEIKGDGSSVDGYLQLNCHVNTHGVKLKAPPHSAQQSYTLTLPSTAPSAGKALITDGNGVLSFGDGGSITTTNSGGLSVTGTSLADFTNLPSGIKRIFVNFYGVSATTDNGALIRLGTSSGFVSSGYGSVSRFDGGYNGDSSGFFIGFTNSTNSINGTVVINHMGNNIFVESHSVMFSNFHGTFGGGYKDLGAPLTQLTVRSVSGGNFDAGLVNIMYQL